MCIGCGEKQCETILHQPSMENFYGVFNGAIKNSVSDYIK